MADPKLTYIPNDAATLSKISPDEVDKNIVELLTSVVEKFPPRDVWPEARKGMSAGGLYCGPTGVAYVSINRFVSLKILEAQNPRSSNPYAIN